MDEELLLAEPRLLRLTADQVSSMVEAGIFGGNTRVELRDGLLRQLNAQYIPHALAKAEIHEALLNPLRALGSGLRIMSEASVRMTDWDIPMPDIIIWAPINLRAPVPVDRVCLVAEISDATQPDDLGPKRRLYAIGGVAEYWVVDLRARVIHQFWEPAPAGYDRTEVVPFGARIASATLAGLAIETTALAELTDPAGEPLA